MLFGAILALAALAAASSLTFAGTPMARDPELVRLHVQIISAAFAAGAVGGVANFLIAPLFGALHLTTALGVSIAPPLLKADLYAKVFWGGLWGALFLLPLRKVVARWWVRALIYGCGPSLVQVLLVFPLTTPYGVGGMGLGALTPVFVFIFNTVGWSIPAYAYFRLNGFEEAGRAPHDRSADDALLPS